ncbi:MAG: hypothetical protein R3C32_07465 [Chloroflexota bacterium]
MPAHRVGGRVRIPASAVREMADAFWRVVGHRTPRFGSATRHSAWLTSPRTPAASPPWTRLDAPSVRLR